ncbi:partial Protein phosphatase PhpP, partial [Anaerolineae bacterium]
GSTVVVLTASRNRCIYQWAGDSRLDRYREGKLEQLTRDHSLLDDLSSQGLLGPEQLADPGRCDIITRAVGAAETLQLDRGECEALHGDLFLLCSDGLDKELKREEIEEVFRVAPKENVAAILVEQAEERGARDNVTVIVVESSINIAPSGRG